MPKSNLAGEMLGILRGLPILSDPDSTPDRSGSSIGGRVLSVESSMVSEKKREDLGVLSDPESMLFADLFMAVAKSRGLLLTAAYIAKAGAATSLILRRRLGIPEPSVHRFLSKLQSLGLIKPCTTARTPGKPPATVWGSVEATEEEIARTIILHRRLQSKKYAVAERVAQTIIEDYASVERLEITYREITVRVKEMRIPFRTPDIAEMVAQILEEHGIKIWR